MLPPSDRTRLLHCTLLVCAVIVAVAYAGHVIAESEGSQKKTSGARPQGYEPADAPGRSGSFTTLASSAVAGQPGERHQIARARRHSVPEQTRALGRHGAQGEPATVSTGTTVKHRRVHAPIARLLNAIAFVESRNSDAAVSKRKARGRFQLMPSIYNCCGIDPHDAVAARGCARRMLARWIRRFGLERGLYAYAWGPGRVQRGERVPASVVLYADRVMTRAGLRRDSGGSEAVMFATKGSR